MTGRIHSFESFGTLDGPGIRFIIFFQGCTLKCKYCHNRDMWNPNEGREVSVADLVKEVESYKPYFKSSGGGVTASGGDPMLQAEFVTEFFKECRKIGIHTALDTAGALPLNKAAEDLLNVSDLVLLDMKHIDDKKCKELTGQGNGNTLAFANYLSEQNIPTWIRYVVVPGYTDDPADVQQLANYIKTLSCIKKIECLPYHTLGKHKWDMLGKSYPLGDLPGTTPQQLKNIQQVLSL